MNDLDCAKEQIRVLEFRNINTPTQRKDRENIRLRDKIKVRKSAVDQFRNKGDLLRYT